MLIDWSALDSAQLCRTAIETSMRQAFPHLRSKEFRMMREFLALESADNYPRTLGLWLQSTATLTSFLDEQGIERTDELPYQAIYETLMDDPENKMNHLIELFSVKK